MLPPGIDEKPCGVCAAIGASKLKVNHGCVSLQDQGHGRTLSRRPNTQKRE
jgi:hypothetical protein